eukprot:PhM_4_TR4331/c1_g1_i1/m.20446
MFPASSYGSQNVVDPDELSRREGHHRGICEAVRDHGSGIGVRLGFILAFCNQHLSSSSSNSNVSDRLVQRLVAARDHAQSMIQDVEGMASRATDRVDTSESFLKAFVRRFQELEELFRLVCASLQIKDPQGPSSGEEEHDGEAQDAQKKNKKVTHRVAPSAVPDW